MLRFVRLRLVPLCLLLGILVACTPVPLTATPAVPTATPGAPPATVGPRPSPAATVILPSPTPTPTEAPRGLPTPAVPTIRVLMHAPGPAQDAARALAATFEAQTGVHVDLLDAADAAADRRFVAQQFMLGQGGIDVYLIDNTWIGLAARHALVLNPYLSADARDHLPALIANNTIDFGLVAMPYTADAGALYSRTDLLARYGYQQPPATWGDLAATAAAVQAGERAAHPDFWGFAWPGAAGDGLTAAAFEWWSGDGVALPADAAGSANAPAVLASLTRARAWIGTISSPATLSALQGDARREWLAGNAAFLRDWASAAGQLTTLPAPGQVLLTALPQGSGPDARRVSLLGGQSLMVSLDSEDQQDALAFVRLLTGADAQTARARALGMLPTRSALYDDAALLGDLPYLAQIRPILLDDTISPGAEYADVTAAVARAVHEVLGE